MRLEDDDEAWKEVEKLWKLWSSIPLAHFPPDFLDYHFKGWEIERDTFVDWYNKSDIWPKPYVNEIWPDPEASARKAENKKKKREAWADQILEGYKATHGDYRRKEEVDFLIKKSSELPDKDDRINITEARASVSRVYPRGRGRHAKK